MKFLKLMLALEGNSIISIALLSAIPILKLYLAWVESKRSKMVYERGCWEEEEVSKKPCFCIYNIQMTESLQITNKILLKGDTNVGKSSLQNFLCRRPFDPSYTPTIGAHFQCISVGINNLDIKTYIWDLSGSQRYQTINLMHYKTVNGIVLMYDSFQNLRKWVEQINQGSPEAVKMVLANKADLEEHREVSEDVGRSFADEMGLQFYEVSMKTGKNVKEAIDALLLSINKEMIEKEAQKEQKKIEKQRKPLVWKVVAGLGILGFVGICTYAFRKTR